MILLDANLLVYAWNRGAPEHERACAWLQARLNDRTRVGIPWSSSLAFVRLVSNQRIFERALPVDVAWCQVEEWLSLPNVWTPEPAQRHREILRSLLPQTDRSQLVPDAHLAALAIEYGLVLQSTDRDFARFSGLQWENPISA
ncbi:MAG: PIN domain-containing protein [Gemmatimonadetes bacterium]|nr:PIN domain-containing protein [Gemmatimonadota bacterium]